MIGRGLGRTVPAAKVSTPMITTRTIAETRRHTQRARRAGRSIGFVPTMGALHSGHWSLVSEARCRCNYVVVSIFVNPTQFVPGEDFDKYPRSLEADLRGCREQGVDLVFAPDTPEMYPDRVGSAFQRGTGFPPARDRLESRSHRRQGLTTVTVGKLTEPLCGRSRPGHFDGVTTVVAKLFNIVSPDVALFGEKDYQQLVVVRCMVRDLNMPVEVVACPTVREPGGLAVSSRNNYLTPEQRAQASCLYRALQQAADAIARGETDAQRLIQDMEQTILGSGAPPRGLNAVPVIDYIRVVDPDSLEDVDPVDRPVRICLAVRIGACRLIDNIGADPPLDDCRLTIVD